MNKRIPKSRVGEIFQNLYDSEIVVRFEWWPENGFTWSIITSSHDQPPRIMVDDEASAGYVIVSKSISDYDNQIKPPVFVEPDWIRRGNDDDIEVALYELVEAVCEIYPNSEFCFWYKKVFQQL